MHTPIPQMKNAELKSQFPDLWQLLELEELPKSWLGVGISPFRDWLSIEEQIDLIDLSTKSAGKALRRRINGFNRGLVDQYRVLGLSFSSSTEPVFSEFPRRKSVCNYLNYDASLGRGSTTSYKVAIPEISAVYIEHFDYINFLFYRDEVRISVVQELAANCGLYMLRY